MQLVARALVQAVHARRARDSLLRLLDVRGDDVVRLLRRHADAGGRLVANLPQSAAQLRDGARQARVAMSASGAP